MSSETGPVGRLSKEEICGVRVIDDSYNASPASMCAAIETLVLNVWLTKGRNPRGHA